MCCRSCPFFFCVPSVSLPLAIFLFFCCFFQNFPYCFLMYLIYALCIVCAPLENLVCVYTFNMWANSNRSFCARASFFFDVRPLPRGSAFSVVLWGKLLFVCFPGHPLAAAVLPRVWRTWSLYFACAHFCFFF